MKTLKFHVNGMHCKACVALTEAELCELPEVKNAKASLSNLNVEVTGEFGEKDPNTIAKNLSSALIPHGYSLSVERPHIGIVWKEFYLALPLAAMFVFLFLLLQKTGIVNLISSSEVSLGTAFVVGLIASVSTCMAVVGGLVLSVSANFAKAGDNKRPQTFFHLGRLVSFFVLGGVIGALGSVFQLGINSTVVLNLIVGIIMLILGINLLDVFPSAKKFQLTLPTFFGKHVRALKNLNHTFMPVLVGIATFFLPCGFTQSMQLYTLTTGSFFSGGLLMLFFALGTLPVLAIISFSSLAIHDKFRFGIFYKTAGLVVIFFSVFNILSSLAAKGIINPIFNI